MTTLDINVKKLKKNNYRVSKVRGEAACRVRCPGGMLDTESLHRVIEIANTYGNGTINFTNRQGIEIPAISMRDMEKVNKELQLVIDNTKVNQTQRDAGYDASGTRNIVACPGSRLCPFGCYDTKGLAQKVDRMIFPNDLHTKIAFTGCSNDCAHVRLNDWGIMGQTEPQYNKDRCVSCKQCVKYCEKRSVGALKMVNGKVVRDPDKCIGCGVCVHYCPTRAWTRSKEHYFRVVLLGRTGKKNPRLAEDFIKWCDEESLLQMIQNAYAYGEEYIDPHAVEGKEHYGYIVDRTGFDEFYQWIMKDVTLNPKAEVNTRPYWGGKHYNLSNNLKSHNLED